MALGSIQHLLGVKANSLTNSYADCLEIVIASTSRSRQGISRYVMGERELFYLVFGGIIK